MPVPSEPAIAPLETVAPSPQPLPRIVPRPAGSTPRLAVLVAIVLVFAAAAAVVFWRRSPPPAATQSTPAMPASQPPQNTPAPAASPVATEPTAPKSISPARGETASRPSPPATIAPVVAPAEAPGRMTADPLLAFGDLKLLTVDPKNGREGREQDVVLHFAGGQLSVVPKKGGAAIEVVPYSQITHATYVNAKRPQWSPAAASPPSDLDVPGGFLGIGNGGRSWLTVQTQTGYVILRLQNNAREILRAVEIRTGVKVDSRPAGNQ